MKKNGFTLIELVIIIGIVGILSVIGGVSTVNLVRKYRVENQTQMMYNDIMNLRLKSMHSNRSHVFTIASNRYRAYRDSDANGTFETEIPAGNTDFKYPLQTNVVGSQVVFDSRGLTNNWGTVCTIYTGIRPNYDCIVISQARISLGKIKPGGGCNANDCEIQ